MLHLVLDVSYPIHRVFYMQLIDVIKLYNLFFLLHYFILTQIKKIKNTEAD